MKSSTSLFSQHFVFYKNMSTAYTSIDENHFTRKFTAHESYDLGKIVYVATLIKCILEYNLGVIPQKRASRKLSNNQKP